VARHQISHLIDFAGAALGCSTVIVTGERKTSIPIGELMVALWQKTEPSDAQLAQIQGFSPHRR
jgi:hypothetical protein